MRIHNNWKPETRSLLRTLIAHGFEIVGATNGEEEVKKDGRPLKVIVDCLTATDEGHLYVKHHTADRDHWLFLVYGNGPGELVSDHNILMETKEEQGKYIPANEALDRAHEAHQAKWEGRKQPTVKVAD